MEGHADRAWGKDFCPPMETAVSPSYPPGSGCDGTLVREILLSPGMRLPGHVDRLQLSWTHLGTQRHPARNRSTVRYYIAAILLFTYLYSQGRR